MNVRVHITQSIARPPRTDVIISPDEGVYDGLEVLNLDIENEYHGCKFAAPVKKTQRHKTHQIGHDGEEDPAHQIGCQAGARVRRGGRVYSHDGARVPRDK